MKKLLFILLMLLTSCITTKQDRNKLQRISQRHPEVIAEKCASSFNPTDSVYESIVYLPGETKYIDTFVEVNCDSVIDALKNTNKIKDINTSKIKIKVKCPPSIRDTILKYKFVKEVDKASIFLLEKSKDSLSTIITQQNLKIKNKNRILYIIGSIIGLLAIWFIFKNYIKTII